MANTRTSRSAEHGTKCLPSQLTSTTSSRERHFDSLHFTDDGTEAQRSHVTHPKSLNEQLAEWELDLKAALFYRIDQLIKRFSHPICTLTFRSCFPWEGLIIYIALDYKLYYWATGKMFRYNLCTVCFRDRVGNHPEHSNNGLSSVFCCN